MLVQTSVKQILSRHAEPLQQALRTHLASWNTSAANSPNGLETMYGQMGYHLGWVDQAFQPRVHNTGKLLRPSLLLLAYEAGGAERSQLAGTREAYLSRALPAAVAVELFHNFTLIHDDIEDGDMERRHRPTVWAVWGLSQGCNTGDGLNCLSRLALLKLLDAGVDATLLTQLLYGFDHTCLSVIEGQHLDLSFEKQERVTIPMYLEMITRKTAALMACATEMGARLATNSELLIAGLQEYGLRLGIAFQIRDDLLGIWATHAETGKTPAGDLLRRKKTLPILHALEHAYEEDQNVLRAIYRDEEAVTSGQVSQILSILNRTGSRQYCQHAMAEQCEKARDALAGLPIPSCSLAKAAVSNLTTLVTSIEEGLYQT